MRKVSLIIIMFLVCLASIICLPVMASDISNAKWIFNISIANNGTAASNIAVPYSLNSSSMIAQNFANSGLTDIAQRYAGSDICFMPGYGSNPWITFIDSISSYSAINHVLYTNGASGGEEVYFPGESGISVNADATLDIGNNGSYTWNGFLNLSSAEYLFYKSHDIRVFGNGAGLITASIPSENELSYISASSQYCNKAAGVVSPSGGSLSIDACFYVNALTGTTQVTLSDGAGGGFQSWSLYMDNNRHMYLTIGRADGLARCCTWTQTGTVSIGARHYITATYDATDATRAKVYIDGVLEAGVDGSAGGNIYQPNTHLSVGAMETGGYSLFFNGYIDEVRISNTERSLSEHNNFYNGGNGVELSADANTISLWHFNEGAGNPSDTTGNNNLTRVNNPTWTTTSPLNLSLVSLASISEGAHTFTVSLAGGTFGMVIDGASNTTAFSGSIPASGTPLIFGTNNTILYFDYIKIYKAGTLNGYWYWEYGATFTDQSGNGNTATPTFRTTTSDADVTASIINFEPVTTAAAGSAPAAAGEIFSDITAPPEMYAEGDYSHIPAAEIVNTILNTTSVPLALWWYPFIFIGIGILGIMVFSATKSQGGEGSLLTQCIVCDAFLFLLAIMGPIMLWPGILFWIPAGALILSRKHYGYG